LHGTIEYASKESSKTKHKRLDEAVFAAYGWKSEIPDEEILEMLLKLILERAMK
jgi:hypothetical protein